MSTWWDLLKALRTHLTGWADLTGVTILTGPHAQIPEAATVELIRGQTPPDAGPGKISHTQTVWVQCWEYDTNADPGVAYGLLATLEQKVVAALKAFGKGTYTVAGVHATQIQKIGPAAPDGDVFRPSVGSRMEVTIEWRD